MWGWIDVALSVSFRDVAKLRLSRVACQQTGILLCSSHTPSFHSYIHHYPPLKFLFSLYHIIHRSTSLFIPTISHNDLQWSLQRNHHVHLHSLYFEEVKANEVQDMWPPICFALQCPLTFDQPPASGSPKGFGEQVCKPSVQVLGGHRST